MTTSQTQSQSQTQANGKAWPIRWTNHQNQVVSRKAQEIYRSNNGKISIFDCAAAAQKIVLEEKFHRSVESMRSSNSTICGMLSKAVKRIDRELRQEVEAKAAAAVKVSAQIVHANNVSSSAIDARRRTDTAVIARMTDAIGLMELALAEAKVELNRLKETA